MYKTTDGSEMLSKKGKIYCSVVVGGLGQTDDFTSARGVALATKLGALCTKVFAVK